MSAPQILVAPADDVANTSDPYTSASFTPTAGAMVFVVASVVGGVSQTAPLAASDCTSSDAGMGAFSIIQQAPETALSAAVYVWYGFADSTPVAQTVTINPGGNQTLGDIRVGVFQMTGVAATGSVFGAAGTTVTVSSASVTLSVAPIAADYVIGVATSRNDKNGFTVGSGFTSLWSQPTNNPAGTVGAAFAEYRTGSTSTTVGMTGLWTNYNSLLGFGVKMTASVATFTGLTGTADAAGNAGALTATAGAVFSVTVAGAATAATTGTMSLAGNVPSGTFVTLVGSALAEGGFVGEDLVPTTDPIVERVYSSVAGPIVTTFRFDLLDTDENLIGELTSVTPGGDVSWSAYGSVKGVGSITVTDVGAGTDWLNVRIRPFIIRTFEGTGLPPVETPLGVFLPSAPVETWTVTGREWTVELADKNSILDADTVVNQWGEVFAYAVGIGANYVTNVIDLINWAGEATPAIEWSDQVTVRPMAFEIGDTRLKIINGLLDASGHFSLWCDGMGQYRVTPYVDPQDRTPLFTWDTPFSKGDLSFMTPDWEADRDIYAIPNRYVVVGQGTSDTEAPTVTAVNVDPDSPFSFQNRGDGTDTDGRWITQVETGVEAADYATLAAYAIRKLRAATAVARTITVRHLYFPELLINTVVRFVNPDADLDLLCVVTKTTVPFDPTALCTSELRDIGSPLEASISVPGS